MLSRKFRFRGRAGIRFAYRTGRVYKSRNLSIRVSNSQKQNNFQMAVVVSKKVSKSAVRRNRIRRRIYDTVRAVQENISKPLDIIVTVHNESVADMPANELKQEFQKLLTEAGVIQK